MVGFVFCLAILAGVWFYFKWERTVAAPPHRAATLDEITAIEKRVFAPDPEPVYGPWPCPHEHVDWDQQPEGATSKLGICRDCGKNTTVSNFYPMYVGATGCAYVPVLASTGTYTGLPGAVVYVR